MEKRTAVNKNSYKINRLFFILLPFIFLQLFFFSCKTTEVKGQLSEVDPLSLLDNDRSVYVSVPVKKHLQITSDILCSEVENLTTENAKKLAERIDILYAGLATVQDRSSVQLAAKGSFPQLALKAFLTQKNGWSKQNYEAKPTEETLSLNYPYSFDYYLRNETEFQISFPSERILCVAQKIYPLLDKYALREEPIASDANSWITQESDDILFYITRPGQYLRNLIGQPISIGCDSISGKVVYVPSEKDGYTGNYLLSFNVSLSEKRAMKSMLLLLDLSMRMMDGEVVQVDDSNIMLKNIPVNEKQIIELFTRDKIKAKHFVPLKD